MLCDSRLSRIGLRPSDNFRRIMNERFALEVYIQQHVRVQKDSHL